MKATAEKVRRFLVAPPRALEIVVWILLFAIIFGIRAYLIHLVPTILWSRDAGSYIGSAFQWMHTGVWETDPRRGPVYSLLIAACLKIFGTMDALMITQHILGGVAILCAAIVLRMLHGRRAILLVGLCGWGYAVYSLPLSLEHLVRNETLLFFFASIILASWFVALDREQPHWLWLTGLATGLMQLTKAVFAPFPLVLIALHAWYFRKQPKIAALQIGIFLIAFALPIAAEKVSRHWFMHRPAAPQSGILLYGRTAQFTVLDGGIAPEAKALIAQDVLDYRQLPALNNNLVLKITIVPKLNTYISHLGKTPSDLNRLCRNLAIEGIMAHKLAYTKQVLSDLHKLLFKCAFPHQSPTVSDVASTERTMKSYTHADPYMQPAHVIEVMEQRLDKHQFDFYRHRVREAWLFYIAPVFLTALFLPFWIYFSRGTRQIWWLGCAAMFYFTLILLSTVGRPLDRYLLPAVPIMFWTLASTLIAFIFWLAGLIQKRWPENSVNPAQPV